MPDLKSLLEFGMPYYSVYSHPLAIIYTGSTHQSSRFQQTTNVQNSQRKLSKERVETCTKEIKERMTKDFLKLKDAK